MGELENSFLKNQIQKKKQKIKVKVPRVNKKSLTREGTLVQTKTCPRKNYEWIGKTI